MMSGSKHIQNPACCIYCRKQFIVKGKQRWHNCEKAMAAKRAIGRKRWNEKYKQGRRYVPKSIATDMKEGWKQCKRCKALTPNYFGICRNCLSVLGTIYDLDAIMTFDRGFERRA